MSEFHEWGKWSRHNPDRLDYPRPWLEMIMRDNVPSPSDGYNITDVPHNEKSASKSARHKALGNSMAVLVMRYIGQQIENAVTYNRSSL